MESAEEQGSRRVPRQLDAVERGERAALSRRQVARTCWTPTCTGAGYGPVVPDYVAAAGVKDVADLAANADKFDKKFYGIEAGNDGNKIDPGQDRRPGVRPEGLRSGRVHPSRACWPRPQKSMQNQEWVAFLGWAPHPVMGKMNRGLSDGLRRVFWSGFGEAQIITLIRAGYLQPNARTSASCCSNLKFTVGRGMSHHGRDRSRSG